MQEMHVPCLDWEDSLEEEMGTHSSILAWKTPWTEESGVSGADGVSESDVTEQLSAHIRVISSALYIF